jgi:hypothetical protein
MSKCHSNKMNWGASFERLTCMTMTEPVRADVALDASPHGSFADDPPHLRWCEVTFLATPKNGVLFRR